MKISMNALTLIALALLAPAVAVAQQPDTLGPWPLGRVAGDVVLQYRTQLSLTPQQLTQIEQIRARTATRNQPLLARVRAAGLPTTPAEARAMTVGQMQSLRDKRRELAPTIREIRANQAAASREIQNLLTLEQYARLRDIQAPIARAGAPGRGVAPGARVGPAGRGFRPGLRAPAGPGAPGPGRGGPPAPPAGQGGA